MESKLELMGKEVILASRTESEVYQLGQESYYGLVLVTERVFTGGTSLKYWM